MSESVDVAIVGGGMAGAGLALLLAKAIPAISIILIEQHALELAATGQLAMPSFDARSTALSCSTQKILDQLGLWASLQAIAEPILQVHVSERSRPMGMLMSANDSGQTALGFVVENRHLGNTLLQAVLSQSENIRAMGSSVVQRIHFSEQGASLSVQSETSYMLNAGLVVVADGAQSMLRQQLGISADVFPYDQHALVANVVTELAHHGVAYERFTDVGPVALLPLQDCENQHRAALIWTLPDSDIQSVMALPEQEFLQRLQQQIGQRCGKLLSVGARYCYPLSLVQAREQVRSRLVLMGSAAHHLHPVAGQGFNLIMRDCEALANILKSAVAQENDIGDLAVLKAYMARQEWDQQKTVAVSDWLPRLFSNKDRVQMLLRAVALLGLDFLPGLREWFTREATGIKS